MNSRAWDEHLVGDTWLVLMWLSNVDSASRYWLEQARIQQAAAMIDASIDAGPTEQTAHVSALARQLKAQLSTPGTIVVQDLRRRIVPLDLARVDWDRVAQHLYQRLRGRSPSDR